jgi:hypothetical protein
MISPDDMKALVEDPTNEKHRYTIYVVPFETKHMV